MKYPLVYYKALDSIMDFIIVDLTKLTCIYALNLTLSTRYNKKTITLLNRLHCYLYFHIKAISIWRATVLNRGLNHILVLRHKIQRLHFIRSRSFGHEWHSRRWYRHHGVHFSLDLDWSGVFDVIEVQVLQDIRLKVVDFDLLVPNEVFAVLEEAFVRTAVEVNLLAAVE